MAKNKNMLPDSFFRQNLLDESSAAFLAHFAMITSTLDELNSQLDEKFGELLESERLERIHQERKTIEEVTDPTMLVELARKIRDPFNKSILCSRIAAFQEQTMPLMLRRFRTCALDHFIEITATLLATCEEQFVYTLREMYEDIRAPYAQANACLVFGVRQMEEEISFLHSEYERFKKEYPYEDFEQFPLLALYLLHGKF